MCLCFVNSAKLFQGHRKLITSLCVTALFTGLQYGALHVRDKGMKPSISIVTLRAVAAKGHSAAVQCVTGAPFCKEPPSAVSQQWSFETTGSCVRGRRCLVPLKTISATWCALLSEPPCVIPSYPVHPDTRACITTNCEVFAEENPIELISAICFAVYLSTI